MYCTSCGKQVPDSTKFCPYCGTRLVARDADNGQPAVAPAGAGPGPAAPVDGLDEPDAPGAADGAADAAAPKKRRRWPFVVAAVLVVAVLVAVALFFLMGGDDTGSAEDGEVSVTETYYSDESIPVVLSSTTIVFYSDDGEELEEYDLYLMDGAGALTHCHVDPEGGRFSAGAYGIEPGTYRMIVREPETNTVHTVSKIVVADEDDGDAETEEGTDSTGSDASADDDADDDGATGDDADDGADYTYYDDELVIKPDPDDADGDDGSDSGSDSGSTTSARQAAYALYYERVVELQELYGEATLVDDGYGGATITGVAFVGLVDIALNGDGIEELVVVYGTETEWFDGTIEVWTYDAEANDIELVCEEPFGATDDVVSLSIYDFGDDCWVLWNYWGSGTFDYYIVDTGEDGVAVAHAFSADYNSEIYLVDHEEVTFDEFEAAYMDYALGDASGTTTQGFYLWVYSTEDWYSHSYSDADSYYSAVYLDPADTLAYTQETIEALRFGMMGITEDELWGVDDGVDAEAVYEGYAATLSSYQAAHGSVSQESEYDDYPYLTGLCFAKLVDFDGDGVDELVLAYSTDDVSSENGWTDNYAIEVWGANAAGDGAELLFQGSEWMEGNGNVTGGVAIAVVDGVYYLIQGESTDNSEMYAYSLVDGEFVQVKSAVVDYDYESMTATYLVDGAECSSEEFEDAWETYTEELTVYWLMRYGDDYSDATTSLSETLTELGAA